MAELNLKQITDKLNIEFSGEGRKLVFWYDDNGDFSDDIDSIELKNAKIYKLEKDNQFRTKYFLERVDKENNYLIYAPFSKPDVSDNHLEDTLLYSKRFFADRTSLLCADLGISDKYKSIIEKHIKFFAKKERTQRFYDLKIENYNEESIIIGILSAVCKIKVSSLDEVVRVLLTEGNLKNNKYIEEFGKYGMTESFWKLCEQQFGYNDPEPSLERLVVTMFATYADRNIQCDVPFQWQKFVAHKSGNIISFLDNMMNNVLYWERYDELSDYAADILNVKNTLKDYYPENIVYCESFTYIDSIIIDWIRDRLITEDTGAKLGELSIPEICEMRSKMHFGNKFSLSYELLSSAYYIVVINRYDCAIALNDIIEEYQKSYYSIDMEYRRFYYSFDRVEDKNKFNDLRQLIENIYTNEYLYKQLSKWNDCLTEDNIYIELNLQMNFYNKYVKNCKDRVVVIISDAMRYEVGRELFEKLLDNPKASVNIEAMISTLPSVTGVGMAALLPHKKIEITDDYKITVDGRNCRSIDEREAILQNYNEKSRCIQFDDVKNITNIKKLREIFTGNSIIYMYHNQIDVRGEHEEDEVFTACSEAVEEISAMISRIASSGNTYHFIVTSDHGFIYKRDKVQECDKISGVNDKSSYIKRRYIISDKNVKGDGICSIKLGYILNNDDKRFVSFPYNTNVFKTTGGGLNYVHGGSSPQEMVIPVIDVKMEKNHVDVKTAEIQMISNISKITNLLTSIDFIQSEPVSDVVKSTSYKVYFVSEDNEKVSNENIYIADKRDEESQKRIFRLRFNFKNKTYDINKRYYLVAYDGDKETLRHEFIIDIPFADDFGF